MLKAIFYARFHTERGPSVVHQYPSGSILSREQRPLISWSDISSYIIPPYELCNQPLSISTNRHRVLAYPISLEDAKYERNRFTFNICFVLAEDEDAQAWEQVVRKTARFLAALEEEDDLLKLEEDLTGLRWAGEDDYPAAGLGILYKLLRTILEDLNAYGETCLRIDSIHILNLRLEFERAVPTKLRSWHVPLLIRSIPSSLEWTWDLTLQRIHSYIDGIRHVQRIAELADVEVKLVKRAVKELVYHGHAMLLDVFHFQAIYTCTENVTLLIHDEDLQKECRAYISVNEPKDTMKPNTAAVDNESYILVPTQRDIIELYYLLQPGMQLAEFCIIHKTRLNHIDMRRFITFGVIKGLLRRVHKYALAMDPQIYSPAVEKKKSGGSASKPKSNEDVVREFDRAWRKAALSSGWATPPSGPPPASLGRSSKSADRVRLEEDEKLREYLDGNHCMDQICVEMHLSEKKIIERLRSNRFGDVILFNK